MSDMDRLVSSDPERLRRAEIRVQYRLPWQVEAGQSQWIQASADLEFSDKECGRIIRQALADARLTAKEINRRGGMNG